MSHNFHPTVVKGGHHRHQKAFTEVNDSFEDDYQAAQFYHRKPPKTRIETGSNSSSYSVSVSAAKQHMMMGAKKSGAGLLKRPRSSCSSNSSRSSATASQQGLTRLRLSRRSTAKLGGATGCSTTKHGAGSKHHLLDCASRSSCGGSSGRESSTESLDKIHTFNLKNSSIAGRRLSDGTTSSIINQSEALKSSGAAGVY